MIEFTASVTTLAFGTERIVFNAADIQSAMQTLQNMGYIRINWIM